MEQHPSKLVRVQQLPPISTQLAGRSKTATVGQQDLLIWRFSILCLLWLQCWSSNHVLDYACAVSSPLAWRSDSPSALGMVLHEVLPNWRTSICSWWPEKGKRPKDSSEVHLSIHCSHFQLGVSCCELALFSFFISCYCSIFLYFYRLYLTTGTNKIIIMTVCKVWMGLTFKFQSAEGNSFPASSGSQHWGMK